VNDGDAKKLEQLAQAELDRSGRGCIGTLKATVLVTPADDQEARVAKLSAYFHQFLASWLDKLMDGVRFTPAITRALATALIDIAIAVEFATDARRDRLTDEQIGRTTIELSNKLIDMLEREVMS